MNARKRLAEKDSSEIRHRIIASLEKFSDSHNYWKTIPEIANITGISTDDANRFIQSFDEFAKNTSGKYTTRSLYRKYTPFFRIISDAYIGKIQ